MKHFISLLIAMVFLFYFACRTLACPNFTGKYFYQGEDIQSYRNISQKDCSSIKIDSMVLILDGKPHPLEGEGKTGKATVTAKFMGDSLERRIDYPSGEPYILRFTQDKDGNLHLKGSNQDPKNPTYPVWEKVGKESDNTQKQMNQLTIHSEESGTYFLGPGGPGPATPVELLMERGVMLFRKKEYIAARKYFERVTTSYPKYLDRPVALAYLGECDRHIQDAASAVSTPESKTIGK